MKLNVTKTIVVAALAFSSAAFAQTPAPAPDSTLAWNLGVVTDYRFRGISQSRLRPAVQGGVDFTHSSGFYLGFWASSIKILKDIPGGDGPVELDFYGGYRGTFGTSPLGYDVGVLRYQYPKENFTPTVNTTEIYGALTYGTGMLKYSVSAGKETFGVPNSRGSYYLEAAYGFDLGNGWMLTPHIGHSEFDGAAGGPASYSDYSLTLAKDFGNGFVGTAALVGTDAGAFYTNAGGKDLGKNGLVLGLKYNF